MSTEDLWTLIALILLIALSAFFSASETALTTLNKIRLKSMVDEHVPGAKRIDKLIANPGKLLGAILVGNNIVNIGASALATSLAIKYFGNTGVGIATGIMTLLILIFAEITPKSMASQNSEKVSLKVAAPITFVVVVLRPITKVLLFISEGIIKLFGGKKGYLQPLVTESEIRTMIDLGHEEGVLEGEEKRMIHNVIEFGESTVSDVMTPRTYMVAIDIKTSYDEIANVFKQENYSRLPVYEDNVDNIIGIISLKDFFLCNEGDEPFDINRIMTEPYFTFEYNHVTQLFHDLRQKRLQIAIVVDEYGGTAGVITIEDLVEEIVGEIHDESDELTDEIEKISEIEYHTLGLTKIELVNERIGSRIESDDYDSIGGFVLGRFGRLPKAGEQVTYDNIRFLVESVHRYRIEKLRIFLDVPTE